MKRCQSYAFFAIHMVGGFLELWLCHYYVQLRLVHVISSNLLLQTLLETAFLILTVVWGSVGWDSYKDLRAGVQRKNLASELAASTASLTIALPVFTAVFDFVLNYKNYGLIWSLHKVPVVLLWMSIFVGILLIIYRKKFNSRQNV